MRLSEIIALARADPEDRHVWDLGLTRLHGVVPTVSLQVLDALTSAEMRAFLALHERCREQLAAGDLEQETRDPIPRARTLIRPDDDDASAGGRHVIPASGTRSHDPRTAEKKEANPDSNSYSDLDAGAEEKMPLIRLTPSHKEEVLRPEDDLAFALLGVRGCASLVSRIVRPSGLLFALYLGINVANESICPAPGRDEEVTCTKPLWLEMPVFVISTLIVCWLLVAIGAMQKTLARRLFLQAGTVYVWIVPAVYAWLGLYPTYADSPVRGSIWLYLPALVSQMLAYPTVAMSDALPGKLKRPVIRYFLPCATVSLLLLCVFYRLPGAEDSRTPRRTSSSPKPARRRPQRTMCASSATGS